MLNKIDAHDNEVFFGKNLFHNWDDNIVFMLLLVYYIRKKIEN